MNMRCFFSIGMILCLLGCASPVVNEVWAPVTNELLEGAWVGYDETGGSLYRLVFKRDGTGEVGIVYQGSTAYRYPIRQWSIADNHVVIQLDGTSTPISHISARAEAVSPPRVFLHLKESGGWSEMILLRREDLLERDIAILKNG